MLVMIVSLEIQPGKIEEFKKIAQDDATCSARDEPGCVAFDVIQDVEKETHFLFREVYKDEAALEAHRQTPHYARWRADSAKVLVADATTRTRGVQVFPAYDPAS